MLYDFSFVDRISHLCRPEMLQNLLQRPTHISLFYSSFSDEETRFILKNNICHFSFFDNPSEAQQDIFLDVIIAQCALEYFNFKTALRHIRLPLVPRLQIALLLDEAPQFVPYILNYDKSLPEEVVDYLTIKKLAT